jgi:hypothetical protein
MPCANCKYYDDNERWGSKGYCSYYRQYVYPDDRTCSHYQAYGGCIFTTACCSYLGLPDDCDELMTMRGFRDNYLRFLPDGEDMIAEYYRIAQPIVDVINSKSDKDSIYKAIYETVKKCVSFVKAEKNEEAFTEYTNMISDLKNKYAHSEG